MIGTYSNKTTNAFRKVNSILYTITQIFAIIALICGLLCGVSFLVLGILALNAGFELPPEVVEILERYLPAGTVAQGIGIATLVFGSFWFFFSLLYFLPLSIVSGILRKHNNREDYKQFIALAIVSGIFGMYVEMAFSIVIYVFESRAARRSNVIDAK